MNSHSLKVGEGGVPVCFANKENLPYLYFGSRYQKFVLWTEDINQKIFATFHQNLSLLGVDDSILRAESQQIQHLNQLPWPGKVGFS